MTETTIEVEATTEQKTRARLIFNSLVHAHGWFTIDADGRCTKQVGDSERRITMIDDTTVEMFRWPKRTGSANFFRLVIDTEGEDWPSTQVKVEGTPTAREAEILTIALVHARTQW
jgi:hypothetical protein